MEKMKKHENRITYGQRIDENNFSLDVFDAGHIPGSTAPLLEIGGKRILYVCDFNSEPTRLLNGARIDVENPDILMIESTYAEREHMPRDETEKKFFDAVKATIENEGIVVLPCFAVGRAAEILMVLNSFNPDFPIYLDGMAKSATDISLKYPELLRDPKALKKALKRVREIWDDKDRKKAIKEPCAIVTSSGMLEGGPSVRYVKYLYDDPTSSVVFTGFLLKGTAGRILAETGRLVTEGFDLKIKMNVYHFDFSAHSGHTQLFNFVDQINPQKIICLHGDNCEWFAKELKEKGFDAIAPENGETIEI
jgi:putative mRNA 3-end processing factor